MQSASTILMIRPACFFYNEETGKSNVFQKKSSSSAFALTEAAQSEFDEFVAILQAKGVEVFQFADSLIPAKPDAIFPNNWISFHETGEVFTYPMQSVSRRSERRLELIQEISKRFQMKELIDLAHFESQGLFLEGTGSMVLDRENKIVYACLSPRTNSTVIKSFASRMRYECVVFKAKDENGKLIYHTNVMMSVGEKFAVVCLESIPDLAERTALIHSLSETEKEIIPISLCQMNAFAGNLLQIKSKKGEDLIVLSLSAYKALDNKQLKSIAKYGELIPIEIPTIEKIGGGSVRCMMAEVFLKKN